MSDQNFLQQAGNFAADGEIDSAADNFLNRAFEAVVSHIPGEQNIDQALVTEVDQVANNALNAEISKLEGML